MRRPSLLDAATYLVVFSSGVFVANLVYGRGKFKLDYEIDPVAAAALLLTAGISLAFYRKLERQKYSDQLRKTATLERLQMSLDKLLALEETCTQQDIKYTDIVSGVRKCRREFEGYVGFAHALSCPVSDASLKDFQLLCAQLKDLLTNTPPRGTKNPPLRVANGRIQISEGRMVEVEQRIDAGKEMLFAIQKTVILDV